MITLISILLLFRTAESIDKLCYVCEGENYWCPHAEFNETYDYPIWHCLGSCVKDFLVDDMNSNKAKNKLKLYCADEVFDDGCVGMEDELVSFNFGFNPFHDPISK